MRIVAALNYFLLSYDTVTAEMLELLLWAMIDPILVGEYEI